MSKKPKTYRVVQGTSLRKSTDPESEDYEAFIDYRPGRRVAEDDFPEHAPVASWVRSGHLAEVKED